MNHCIQFTKQPFATYYSSCRTIRLRIHKGGMENHEQQNEKEERKSEQKTEEAIRVAVMLIDQTMHSPKRMKESWRKNKKE